MDTALVRPPLCDIVESVVESNGRWLISNNESGKKVVASRPSRFETGLCRWEMPGPCVLGVRKGPRIYLLEVTT